MKTVGAATPLGTDIHIQSNLLSSSLISSLGIWDRPSLPSTWVRPWDTFLAISSCFVWLKHVAWSLAGRLSTRKECKRDVKQSTQGSSQQGKNASRTTTPQREELYREQGNKVAGKGSVCNYKLLISTPIRDPQKGPA